MRRLLIIPAALLVLLGGPVLALESTAPPLATTDEVPVAPPGQTVSEGWQSAPTPIDANLVGVTWDGDPTAEFSVEVRGADGRWTKPIEVGSDADNQAEPGTQDAVGANAISGTVSEPVWVGDDVTDVRVVLNDGEASNVTLATVDAESATAPSGSAGAISSLLPPATGATRYVFAAALFLVAALLIAIAFGFSPWRREARRPRALLVLGVVLLAACRPVAPPPPPPPPPPPAPAPPFAGGTVQPAMTARSQWGARPFGTGPVPCPAGPEYAPKLKFAVVHHTVNSNSYGPGDSAAMVRAIQTYHMNFNGYCDIAYHFVVDKYGQIFEGRAGGTDRPVIGGHAGGFNTGSTSVALLGDYTTTAYTFAEWTSVVNLLRWRLSAGGVDPSLGFGTTVASSPCNCQRWPVGTNVFFSSAIVGHRDVDFTACPGSMVDRDIGLLRLQVQAGIVMPAPPTTTTSSTTTTSTTTTSTTTTSTTLAPSTTTTT